MYTHISFNRLYTFFAVYSYTSPWTILQFYHLHQSLVYSLLSQCPPHHICKHHFNTPNMWFYKKICLNHKLCLIGDKNVQVANLQMIIIGLVVTHSHEQDSFNYTAYVNIHWCTTDSEGWVMMSYHCITMVHSLTTNTEFYNESSLVIYVMKQQLNQEKDLNSISI